MKRKAKKKAKSAGEPRRPKREKYIVSGKNKAIAPRKPKLEGKRVVLAGDPTCLPPEDALKRWIETEGGFLAPRITKKTDIVIADPLPTKKERVAFEREVRKKSGTDVEIISGIGFVVANGPTIEEIAEIVFGGRKGRAKWNGDSMLTHTSCSAEDIHATATKVKDYCFDPVVAFTRCTVQRGKLGELNSANRCKFDGSRIAGLRAGANCSLRSVDLRGARIGSLESCDLRDAKLAEVWIRAGSSAHSCKFDGARLVGANFSRTRFEECSFKKVEGNALFVERSSFSACDFRDAKFRRSQWVNVTFRKVNFGGSDFTGAQLVGCTFDDCVTSGARGLEHPETGGAAGRRVAELDRAVSPAERVEFEILLTESVMGRPVQAQVRYRWKRWRVTLKFGSIWKGDREVSLNSETNTSFGAAATETILEISAEPDFATLKVSSSRCPVKPKALKELAIGFISELCGVSAPTVQETVLAKKRASEGKDAQREKLLSQLKKGPRGVKAWNSLGKLGRRKADHFRESDLRDTKLKGVLFDQLDFGGSNFDGADLSESSLGSGQFGGASFRKTNLTRAKVTSANFEGAILNGALMAELIGKSLSLKGASLKRVDLTGANLQSADLRGADLSSAIFTESTEFLVASYDEKTRFPAGFTPDRHHMEWKGRGTAPSSKNLAKKKKDKKPKSGSADAFVTTIESHVEIPHFKSALKMLRKDKFQLFVEMDRKSLVGIVKSESEPDRTYSCKLASDGTFACCTQNLRPCGGMRGHLCKHLLVLVVGLGKCESRKRKTLEKWVAASVSQKPALDKEAMSETFLRHKGAEAGEIDWRPTETVPEDYYSL